MAHLLSDLVSYFNLDEIEIDNWTWKLFYKVSTALCLLGASIGLAQAYFGKPITCEFSGGINADLANDYCWMHGSSYIPPQYQAHMGCIIEQFEFNATADDYPGDPEAEKLASRENYEKAPKTHYYQWVTFIFAIQAASFYLPYKLWTAMEGGLMASFGIEAKSRVIVRQETDLEDCLIIEALTDRFVKYYKSVFHRNTWYFAQFLSCEVLNYTILMINIAETNKFLNGKFKWYGFDVMQYYNLSPAERRHKTNPMCATFPTEVSCNIPKVGAAGGTETHNGLCVLTQNIINEKMYLIMWFWFVTLATISTFHLFYRVSTILSRHVRFALLYKTIHHQFDEDLGVHLNSILEQGHLGDWFVLYQLSKNTNPYFFREFIRELSQDLKQKPKQSLSNNSNASNTGGVQGSKNNAVLNLLNRKSFSQSLITLTQKSAPPSRTPSIFTAGLPPAPSRPSTPPIAPTTTPTSTAPNTPTTPITPTFISAQSLLPTIPVNSIV